MSIPSLDVGAVHPPSKSTKHHHSHSPIAISQRTTVEEIIKYLETGADVKARMPNPSWYELSSGQYLAINVLAVLLIVVVWVVSYLFRLNSIVTGILVGPIAVFAFELIPRKYLLGYDKLGAAIRLTLFSVYHAVQHRSIGEDNTLLHLAAFFGCSREVILALIEAGAEVSARNSDLNTPLHFASSNLDVVQILIEHGADVNAENHRQKTPLDMVKKAGVAEALLKAGARVNERWSDLVGHEPGSFRGALIIPANVSKKLKPGQHLCFLSHHKVDAATVAVYMHGVLCSRFKLKSNQVFLDSNSLEDLRHLIDLVKSSRVLLVLQTKSTLVRPFCLAEIYTAIQHHIPIVAVNVEGLGYDFEDSKAYLASPSFREALEARNPGGAAVLEEYGFAVDEIGQALNSVLPNIISKPFNPSASERVRASQIDDIVAAILEKF